MTDMTAINPTLTRAGLRAVFAADNDGLSAKITHIALGTSQYTPTGAETALKNEIARLDLAGGRYVDDYCIEVSALLDTDTGFTVAEVGLILEDGTLLAVWSDPDTPLAAYTVGVPIALACFLVISQLPTDSLSFSGDADLNLFFGPEFAQLGAASIANMLALTKQADRIASLEDAVRIRKVALDADRATLYRSIDELRLQIERLQSLVLQTGSLAMVNALEIFETKETLQ